MVLYKNLLFFNRPIMLQWYSKLAKADKKIMTIDQEYSETLYKSTKVFL